MKKEVKEKLKAVKRNLKIAALAGIIFFVISKLFDFNLVKPSFLIGYLGLGVLLLISFIGYMLGFVIIGRTLNRSFLEIICYFIILVNATDIGSGLLSHSIPLIGTGTGGILAMLFGLSLLFLSKELGWLAIVVGILNIMQKSLLFFLADNMVTLFLKTQVLPWSITILGILLLFTAAKRIKFPYEPKTKISAKVPKPFRKKQKKWSLKRVFGIKKSFMKIFSQK